MRHARACARGRRGRGTGSIVAVEGEAGIGKTALLAHAARRASDQRDARSRRPRLGARARLRLRRRPPALRGRAGRGHERSARALARGCRGLATPVISARDAGQEQRPRSRADPARPVLAVGEPGRRRSRCCSSSTTRSGPTAHRWRSCPIWRASVEELPILIVYAARTGAGTGGAAPAVAEPSLVRTVLRPATLSETATQRSCASGWPRRAPPRFARACHAATTGNPFLLAELVRTLEDDGVAPDDAYARCVEQIARRRSRVTRLARLRAARRGRQRAGLRRRRARQARRAAPGGCARGPRRGRRGRRGGCPRRRRDLPRRGVRWSSSTRSSAPRSTTQLAPGRRAAAHKRAARLLAQDGVDDVALAPHLLATEPAGDAWVVERLCRAAQDAGERGRRRRRVHLPRAREARTAAAAGAPARAPGARLRGAAARASPRRPTISARRCTTRRTRRRAWPRPRS